jgi:hypothetical protein
MKECLGRVATRDSHLLYSADELIGAPDGICLARLRIVAGISLPYIYRRFVEELS